MSGKICCYKKLQSGNSRFYWEPHLVYSDCRGNSVNFYFLCLGKTCCYKKLRFGNSRFYWEAPLVYSDCRGNYVNFYFLCLGKTTCCYKKLRSGNSRFYWEPPLVYSDYRGNYVNFYFLCLVKQKHFVFLILFLFLIVYLLLIIACNIEIYSSKKIRLYWEPLTYSDCRGNYVNFYFFCQVKHVSNSIQNFSLEILVFTESRSWCIQIKGGIM